MLARDTAPGSWTPGGGHRPAHKGDLLATSGFRKGGPCFVRAQHQYNVPSTEDAVCHRYPRCAGEQAASRESCLCPGKGVPVSLGVRGPEHLNTHVNP